MKNLVDGQSANSPDYVKDLPGPGRFERPIQRPQKTTRWFAWRRPEPTTFEKCLALHIYFAAPGGPRQ